MVICGNILSYYHFELVLALIALTVGDEVFVDYPGVLLVEEALFDSGIKRREPIVCLCYYSSRQLFWEDVGRPSFDVTQIDVWIRQLALKPNLNFDLG